MDGIQLKSLEIGLLADNPNPNMGLLESLRTRRTIRSYQAKPVPKEVILEILKEAINAPSACNRRGWKFILIDDQKEKEWIYKKGGSTVIRDVGQILLVCYRNDADNLAWRDVEQSAAAGMMCFQLVAHSRGIGSCWICHLPPKRELKKHFGIPDSYSPIAVLSFGYYKKDLKVHPRIIKDLNILSHNKWEFSKKTESSVFKRTIRTVARFLYYLFPKREWFRKFVDKYEKKFHPEVKD